MYNLKFQTITPLHISNGEQLAHNLEYVMKDGELCKFNRNSFPLRLSELKLFKYDRNYRVKDIQKLISENSNNFLDSDFEYKITQTPSFKNYLSRVNHDGQSEVVEFINSNGKFYIPASSVKGAILTILRKESLGISIGSDADIKQKFVFTDSEEIPASDFLIVHSLSRPPNISLIVLKRNIKFNLLIKKIGELDIELLKKNSSDFALKQINLAQSRIIHYSSKYDNDEGTPLMIKSLKYVEDYIKKNNGYYINIGFGGTSWFKIFKGIPDQKDRGQKIIIPHTAFTIDSDDGPLPLGWCKFEIEKI